MIEPASRKRLAFATIILGVILIPLGILTTPGAVVTPAGLISGVVFVLGIWLVAIGLRMKRSG
jgi:hypothetical protein